MIDMKQKPASPVSMLGDVAEEGSYSESLRIELDNESLKRLGIGSGNLPQVGQKFAISGLAEVVEVCKEDGLLEEGYCVELQIQQFELAAPEALNAKPAANEQQQAQAQIERMYQ
jgi:hypothetical protein